MSSLYESHAAHVHHNRSCALSLQQDRGGLLATLVVELAFEVNPRLLSPLLAAGHDAGRLVGHGFPLLPFLRLLRPRVKGGSSKSITSDRPSDGQAPSPIRGNLHSAVRPIESYGN